MKTLRTYLLGFLALAISLLGSATLLASDAQTANKPKDMISITTGPSPATCPGTNGLYRIDVRMMDDLTLVPFTIPAGYKFIVTSATAPASVQLSSGAGYARAMVVSGFNADVAIAPGVSLCVSPTQVIHGHLEKDLP